MTVQLTVSTANICGNPLRPRWAVRKRMRQALHRPGAAFGQEVAAANRWAAAGNYSVLWDVIAARVGKRTRGGPREVPVSYPASWEFLASSVLKVHDGRRLVSPARYITIVCVIVDGIRVALVNCHPVSKPRRGVPASAWRIARWNQYHAQLVRVVAQLVNDGYTVIAGGDMNRRVVPPIHPAQRLLIHAGLDHLWLVPAAGVDLLAGVHTHKIGRTVLMDHPILSATVELRARFA